MILSQYYNKYFGGKSQNYAVAATHFYVYENAGVAVVRVTEYIIC